MHFSAENIVTVIESVTTFAFLIHTNGLNLVALPSLQESMTHFLVYINLYFKNLFNHFESNVNTLRPYLK